MKIKLSAKDENEENSQEVEAPKSFTEAYDDPEVSEKESSEIAPENAPKEYYEFLSDWAEILRSRILPRLSMKKILPFILDYGYQLEQYKFTSAVKKDLDILRKRIGNPKKYITKARAKFSADKKLSVPEDEPANAELTKLLNKGPLSDEDTKKMNALLVQMGHETEMKEKQEREESEASEVSEVSEGEPSSEEIEAIEKGDENIGVAKNLATERLEGIPELTERRRARIQELYSQLEELKTTLPRGEDRTEEQKNKVQSILDELKELGEYKKEYGKEENTTFLNMDVEEISSLAEANLDEEDLNRVHPEEHTVMMRNEAKSQVAKLHELQIANNKIPNSKDESVIEQLTFAQAAFVSEYLKEEIKKYERKKAREEELNERKKAENTIWKSERQHKLTPEERKEKMKEQSVKVFSPEEIERYNFQHEPIKEETSNKMGLTVSYKKNVSMRKNANVIEKLMEKIDRVLKMKMPETVREELENAKFAIAMRIKTQDLSLSFKEYAKAYGQLEKFLDDVLVGRKKPLKLWTASLRLIINKLS